MVASQLECEYWQGLYATGCVDAFVWGLSPFKLLAASRLLSFMALDAMHATHMNAFPTAF